MSPDVRTFYSARFDEYTALFGSMSFVHPSDECLVSSWAHQVKGRLLDAGCGPGHWTAHLVGQGIDALGVDQVSDFVAHAQKTHPGIPFEVGNINALDKATSSLGGVLAWYSLIHHHPSAIHRALDEFARVLMPGGTLLLGFFTGPTVEAFNHAITTAYRWSPEALALELRSAGFDVLETHARAGHLPKPRPHGAIMAQLAVR